jgi:hypothetical protein
MAHLRTLLQALGCAPRRACLIRNFRTQEREGEPQCKNVCEDVHIVGTLVSRKIKATWHAVVSGVAQAPLGGYGVLTMQNCKCSPMFYCCGIGVCGESDCVSEIVIRYLQEIIKFVYEILA